MSWPDPWRSRYHPSRSSLLLIRRVFVSTCIYLHGIRISSRHKFQCGLPHWQPPFLLWKIGAIREATVIGIDFETNSLVRSSWGPWLAHAVVVERGPGPRGHIRRGMERCGSRDERNLFLGASLAELFCKSLSKRIEKESPRKIVKVFLKLLQKYLYNSCESIYGEINGIRKDQLPAPDSGRGIARTACRRSRCSD